ncbi:MAG: tyrosine-type recombinase/integrase [Thermoguttaceae bacterium]|nr:tyrosine-type recombinase/integrase [Thermoguttaceae bacterium]
MSQRAAETICAHVEVIAAGIQVDHVLPVETSAWLAKIEGDLHAKRAKVGLVQPRATTTLKAMLDTLIASRPEAKLATKVVWGQVARDLVRYFGADRNVRTIKPADAEAFRQSLLSRGLSHWTIHRRLEFTRMFFRNAVKRGLLHASPFEGVTQKPGDHGKRRRYVSVDETEKLIDAAPNVWWRTIIALSRYAGMRCPSEVLSLRWEGINWEQGTMRIISPKTDCHDCGGQRVAPIFARLRPCLDEAWKAAAEGQTHVIPETLCLPAAHGPRGWNGCNLRTTFQKIVRRAGLEEWPRLFHALRASCESDLAREYPITTVCKWIGNTVAVAARHYVDPSDHDIRRAAGLAGKAVQNPVQHAPESAGNGISKKRQTPVFAEEYRGLYACTAVQVEAAGIEPASRDVSA